MNASAAALARFVALWTLLAAGAVGRAQELPPRFDPALAELLEEPAGRALLETYRAIRRDYRGDADPERLLEGALRGLWARPKTRTSDT